MMLAPGGGSVAPTTGGPSVHGSTSGLLPRTAGRRTRVAIAAATIALAGRLSRAMPGLGRLMQVFEKDSVV